MNTSAPAATQRIPLQFIGNPARREAGCSKQTGVLPRRSPCKGLPTPRWDGLARSVCEPGHRTQCRRRSQVPAAELAVEGGQVVEAAGVGNVDHSQS